jgi:acyltransferase
MVPAERIPWIDHAKSIGIVLVVLGHAPGVPEAVRGFIYRFHMPLFFFLAGALVRPERFADGFLPWVRRQVRALVVPYVFFWGISTVWWLTIRNIGEKATESAGLKWWSPVKGLLWGTGDTLFVNPPLWFFPAMFVTTVAAWGVWWLTRWGRLRLRIVLAGLAVVILPLSMFRFRGLWWNLDLLPWTLFFYVLGALRGRFIRSSPESRRSLAHLASPLVFLLVTWRVWSWSPFDLNGRLFGDWPWLALGSSTVLVVTVCMTMGLFGGWRPLGGLARNTIVIFPLHGLCFSFFTGVLSIGLHAAGWVRTGGWAAALAYTVGALALCLGVAPLLRRWVPWAVGTEKVSSPSGNG